MNTKEFRDWNEGNKMVDKKGHILKFFHGTNVSGKYDSLDATKTRKKELHFGNVEAGNEFGGSKVYPVIACFKRPFFTEDETRFSFEEIEKLYYDVIRNEYLADGVPDEEIPDWEDSEEFEVLIDNFVNQILKNGHYNGTRTDLFNVIVEKVKGGIEFRDILLEYGFDGIVYENKAEGLVNGEIYHSIVPIKNGTVKEYFTGQDIKITD
jgi:hypothetical protein